MSLLEEIYKDLINVIKSSIKIIVVVYIFWAIISALAVDTYWGTGHYFLAIITVIFLALTTASIGAIIGSALKNESPGCFLPLGIISFIISLLFTCASGGVG
ncbi:hypothetical protein ACFL60_09060 [Candidatus Omnitrophota bacterium]